MTREEADFIGGMNMCEEISNEAYRKIMCHCEEQEPCEDAVSRQAVKEKMIYYGFLAPDMTVTEFVEDCLPSVNPQEPKTGHWIDTGSGQECSECREIQYGYDSFRYFCANCGCRMVEPQESEVKE